MWIEILLKLDRIYKKISFNNNIIIFIHVIIIICREKYFK